MKKLLLIFVGIFLLGATAQIFLEFMGGIPGAVRAGESFWFEKQAIKKHDPGQCAKIGNYLGAWRSDYLREKCLAHYAPHINTRYDCGTHEFITKHRGEVVSLAEYYRQDCLINHYKRMLGNTLTMQWLPTTCSDFSEKLILLSYSLKESMELNDGQNIDETNFLSNADRSSIEQCESTLDTRKIYAFLRSELSLVEESAYVELQKKKFETN